MVTRGFQKVFLLELHDNGWHSAPLVEGYVTAGTPHSAMLRMGTISRPHIREETKQRQSTVRGEKLRGRSMSAIRPVKSRSPSPHYHHKSRPPLEHRRPLFRDSHDQNKQNCMRYYSSRRAYVSHADTHAYA